MLGCSRLNVCGIQFDVQGDALSVHVTTCVITCDVMWCGVAWRGVYGRPLVS